MNSGYAPTLVAHCSIWLQQWRRARRRAAEDLENVLAGTASAGYKALELTQDFFDRGHADTTGKLIQQHRLTVPVVSCQGVMHIQEEAVASIAKSVALAERAKPFGLQALNFGAAAKRGGERKSDQELAYQTVAFDRLGEEMHKRGLRLFIHPDSLQMREDAREWRHILIHTDRELVEFCVDARCVFRSRRDVLQLLSECGTRVADLHLCNSKSGISLEHLGDGDIDYRPIAAYLRKIRFRGYLTIKLAYDRETAIAHSPIESLRRSREYAEKTFGPSI